MRRDQLVTGQFLARQQRGFRAMSPVLLASTTPVVLDQEWTDNPHTGARERVSFFRKTDTLRFPAYSSKEAGFLGLAPLLRDVTDELEQAALAGENNAALLARHPWLVQHAAQLDEMISLGEKIPATLKLPDAGGWELRLVASRQIVDLDYAAAVKRRDEDFQRRNAQFREEQRRRQETERKRDALTAEAQALIASRDDIELTLEPDHYRRAKVVVDLEQLLALLKRVR